MRNGTDEGRLAERNFGACRSSMQAVWLPSANGLSIGEPGPVKRPATQEVQL